MKGKPINAEGILQPEPRVAKRTLGRLTARLCNVVRITDKTPTEFYKTGEDNLRVAAKVKSSVGVARE